jgi:hypothetical protein
MRVFYLLLYPLASEAKKKEEDPHQTLSRRRERAKHTVPNRFCLGFPIVVAIELA